MTKSLRERLNDAIGSASKADRAIATYMMAEFANLPFETAASLAAKVEVSEPTVGRFCRAIGYDGFKDLKKNLRNDMGDQPWLIKDRLRDLQDRTLAGKDQLTRGLEQEMAALVAVYEAAHTPEWKRVVKRLATAPSVYVLGVQAERGIAEVFARQLLCLRDRVQLLDMANGNFADLLVTENTDTALVIFEARPYAQNALLLATEANASGIPVTLITDPYCEWGHNIADEIFVVPTSFNFFGESSTQMASLANLLVNGVFLELGPSVEARMNKIARLYGKFAGHVDQTTPPKAKP